MFSTVFLILFLVLSSSANASPIRRLIAGKIPLGFSAVLDPTGGPSIVDADRARAQALGKGSGQTDSVSAKNAVMGYTAQVGIGDPPTQYTLLVDTGSANTWVGAEKPYRPTHTSYDTNHSVSQTYGSGNFVGQEWLDQVTLTPELIISNQSIGVARSTQNIPKDYDGVLGLGPTDLANGTVYDIVEVPTVVDNLYSQGTISDAVVAILFEPAPDSRSGKITFGGYDPLAITSPMDYIPLTNTTPSNQYWGFDQYITYGNTTIMPKTAGIMDTGSTFILLPPDAFDSYTTATGGGMDPATGMLSITQEQYKNLQPLTFHIGSETYNFSPNAQIWPRSLNKAISGKDDQIYLVVNDMGDSFPGLDFILGYTFLERFYTVYDTTNSRIGIATTIYTDSTNN